MPHRPNGNLHCRHLQFWRNSQTHIGRYSNHRLERKLRPMCGRGRPLCNGFRRRSPGKFLSNIHRQWSRFPQRSNRLARPDTFRLRTHCCSTRNHWHTCRRARCTQHPAYTFLLSIQVSNSPRQCMFFSCLSDLCSFLHKSVVSSEKPVIMDS